MNERVKELRKVLGLSGEKFGEPLGLTKMAISKMENARVSVSDSNIKLIYLTYNVNEEWLRTGEGEMFKNTTDLSLDDIVKSNSIDDLEIEIIKTYFSIDKEKRKSALEYFKNTLSK